MSILKRHANATTDEAGKVTAVEVTTETTPAATASSGLNVGDIVHPTAGGPNGNIESLIGEGDAALAVVVWFLPVNAGWEPPVRSTWPVKGLERVQP